MILKEQAMPGELAIEVSDLVACELRRSSGRITCRVLELLALHPIKMGHAALLAVLREVCATGDADVLAVLARPPYSLGRTEARECGALSIAAASGRVDIVESLARPPFSLDRDDASRCMHLIQKCRRLALPPYS